MYLIRFASAPPASATRCERHSCAMRGVRGDSKLVGRTVFNRYRRRRQMWTRRWAIRLELAASVCAAAAAAASGLEFWLCLALACMLVAAHVGGCAQQVLRRCWCYTASGREWAEAVAAARSRSPSPSPSSPSPSGPSGPSGPRRLIIRYAQCSDADGPRVAPDYELSGARNVKGLPYFHGSA